jgi:hypothetical protein
LIIDRTTATHWGTYSMLAEVLTAVDAREMGATK